MQSYILIGAGGTGSHFIGPALAFLSALHRNKKEQWQFLIVDGDNYEPKNLSRQLFDPNYVGLNKAEALASMYASYPVVGIPKFLGKEDLEELMQEGDIVFIGVDNYSLRALVEARALELNDSVVINAGNEYHDGSVQLWVRQKGKNKTPRLSYGHPEIAYLSADDRSYMTCAQVSELPGGEQLIIANMAAAMHMLTALWRYHSGSWKKGWTELSFDLKQNELQYIDMRERKNWFKDSNEVKQKTRIANA